MKATIDIPDELYRQVKARSALEGRCVREVAVSLFDAWVHGEEHDDAGAAADADTAPSWFGSLRSYGSRADGHHDMDHVRASIARGRARTGK